MFDITTFDGPLFARADMTLSHYQQVLRDSGRVTDAQRLEGCTITNREMAQTALDILHDMHVCAEDAYFRAIAVQCVRDSLSQQGDCV